MNKDQIADDYISIKGVANIEDLRKSYELPHHWHLRREFLQIYKNDYELDRLVCLSNVFVNVECMGLTYPDEVMKLIQQLGSKVRGLETYKRQASEQQQLLEEEEPELPRKRAYNNNRRY